MRYLVIILLFFYSKSSLGLSIDESVKSTITNNLKVKIAFEKLKENKEVIEVAIGKKLPTVTGTISGTYSNMILHLRQVQKQRQKLLQVSIKSALLKIFMMEVKKIQKLKDLNLFMKTQ